MGTPNKVTADIRAAAQLHGAAAIAKLVSLMEGGDTDQVQLSAARELLDRGYGRSRRSVAISSEQPVDNSGLLLQRIADIAARQAKASLPQAGQKVH